MNEIYCVRQYTCIILIVLMLIYVTIYSFVKYEIWKIFTIGLSLIYYTIVDYFYRLKYLINKYHNNK